MRRLFAEEQKGAGLFLDPGLGKTRISLEVIKQLRDLGEVKRVLVVAPLRVCRSVWRQEAEKWGYDFSCSVLCKRTDAGMQENAFVEIINPESLHKLVDHEGRWDLIVIDESTKFKNWGTKRKRSRMKSMRKMLPYIPRRIILTGTPAANSLVDLFAQIFILDDGDALGRNITVFRARFCQQGGFQGRQWELRHGADKELMECIGDMVVRLDAESNLDMPELLVNDVWCDLPQKCVAGYKKLKRELALQLESGDILAANAASAYIKCRQFSNGAIYDEERNVHRLHDEKLDALCEIVEELSGKPVLVFYQFKHDATRILERFPNAPAISGETKGDDVEQIIAKWNRGGYPVLLAQNQSAAHGLNLQGGGNDMVYMGLGDSPEVYDQSYRRLYRQGVQGGQVRVHRLLTRGTVDGPIVERLESKGQTQQQFFNALREHARS